MSYITHQVNFCQLLEVSNLLKDINMQLAWCGTGMPENLLVDIAMHCLESPRYKCNVDQLQIFHTEPGSSYNNLDVLYDALICLDCYHGISYGTKRGSETKSDTKHIGSKFKGTQQALVSDSSASFTFHKDAWIGAIELEEKHMKHIHHIFCCPLCCTNKHNFPQCLILTHTFSITKLIVNDKKGSVSSMATDDVIISSSSGENLGQAASVTIPIIDSSLAIYSDSLMDDSMEEAMIDHLGVIDLDMVDNISSMVL